MNEEKLKAMIEKFCEVMNLADELHIDISAAAKEIGDKIVRATDDEDHRATDEECRIHAMFFGKQSERIQ